MRDHATYLHSGSLGDICYAIPTIRSLSQRATIYLNPDVPDTIPAWAGTRQPFRMTGQQAEQFLPLLNSQPGLTARIWKLEPIDYNLDRFRTINLDLSKGDIARYPAYPFPEAEPILHRPWLAVPPSDQFKGMILINRTTRYRNPHISYRFLSSRSDCVFIGTASEYSEFTKDCPRIPHECADDFLQLAQWIAGCRLLIGNQSFCFSLAQAMMTGRILEVYPAAPNVIIHGVNGHDVIDQGGLMTRFGILTSANSVGAQCDPFSSR